MAKLFPGSEKKAIRRTFDSGALLRHLETRFRFASCDRDRAAVADNLVPAYVSAGDWQSASLVLGRVGDDLDDALAPRIASLRAVVGALEGVSPEPQAQRALEALPELDELSAVVVRHRVGLAYFFARDAAAAEEHSLQALWLADLIGSRRLAAGIAGVLYAVHYHLTGDLQASRYYAEVATVQAAAGGEDVLRRAYLVAQYDLAVVFAEWERARSLQELLRRDASIEVGAAATAARVADVLIAGQRGDFSGMAQLLQRMLENVATTADYALARALRALACAGTGLDAEARLEARRGLALSRSQKDASEPAHLTIRRRIAAVLAAYALVLVGEVLQGSRALKTRMKWPGSIGALARAFEAQVRGARLNVDDGDLHTVKGYAVVANTVRMARLHRVDEIPLTLRTLTSTEVVLLRAAADGKTNAEIARERGVTRNAVERRLMSAYEKLGVRSRAEAITKLSKA